MKRLILLLLFMFALFTVIANPYSFNLYEIDNANGTGATTFLQLTDTPNTYVGSDGRCLKVNGSQISFEDCGNGTGGNGTGDITGVQGDSYITNGSNIGQVNLVFNETRLNDTIQAHNYRTIDNLTFTPDSSFIGNVNVTEEVTAENFTVINSINDYSSVSKIFLEGGTWVVEG